MFEKPSHIPTEQRRADEEFGERTWRNMLTTPPTQEKREPSMFEKRLQTTQFELSVELAKPPEKRDEAAIAQLRKRVADLIKIVTPQ